MKIPAGCFWLKIFWLPLFLLLSLLSFCELSAYNKFFLLQFFHITILARVHTHTHTQSIAPYSISSQPFPKTCHQSGPHGHMQQSALDLLLMIISHFPDLNSFLPINIKGRKFASFTMTFLVFKACLCVLKNSCQHYISCRNFGQFLHYNLQEIACGQVNSKENAWSLQRWQAGMTVLTQVSVAISQVDHLCRKENQHGWNLSCEGWSWYLFLWTLVSHPIHFTLLQEK